MRCNGGHRYTYLAQHNFLRLAETIGIRIDPGEHADLWIHAIGESMLIAEESTTDNEREAEHDYGTSKAWQGGRHSLLSRWGGRCIGKRMREGIQYNETGGPSMAVHCNAGLQSCPLL